MNKIFFLLFCVVSLPMVAQETITKDSIINPFQEKEDAFVKMGNTLIKDTIQTNRKEAGKALLEGLKEMLAMEGTFSYRFDSLKTVSIQYPADSTFRIFTWQLYEDINTYTYFGIIQTNAPQPKVHVLKDKSTEVEELETDILEADSWYGSLYYNLKEFKGKEGKHYLLFGFDGYQLFNKRKIVEVLTFENGEPIFGAPVFEPVETNRPDLTKSRLILTYSAETTVRLNFDETLDIIIFDNLMTGGGNIRGVGPVMLPDGSYKGYKLEGKRWVYQDKIFDHIYEKPPFPAPILGNGRKGRDVFGND